jgi:hypothetical protein
MQSYGFTHSRSNYELAHLISLEIGGNPKDVRNLWPEPAIHVQTPQDKKIVLIVSIFLFMDKSKYLVVY